MRTQGVSPIKNKTGLSKREVDTMRQYETVDVFRQGGWLFLLMKSLSIGLGFRNFHHRTMEQSKTETHAIQTAYILAIESNYCI